METIGQEFILKQTPTSIVTYFQKGRTDFSNPLEDDPENLDLWTSKMMI